MPDDDALRFAERLLALLERCSLFGDVQVGETLLAIVDVTAERTRRGGKAPDVISGTDDARRVIELY